MLGDIAHVLTRKKSRKDSISQWLKMERGTIARRREKTSAQPKKPPMRLRHHNRTQSESTTLPASPPSPVSSGRLITRNHENNHTNNGYDFEGTKGHRRNDTVPTVAKSSVYSSEDNPRNFTVVNVGAGGVLYLKPSRVAGPNPNYAPATPPATSSDGESCYHSRNHHDDDNDCDGQGEQPLLPPIRDSDASIYSSLYSGTRTPRMSRSRTAGNMKSSLPPVSLHNPHNRRATQRSLSCSTLSDRERLTRHDAHEFQLPSNEHERPRQRRRSSADLDRGELGVSIPHYRLGTPRFSDRGTAYLHSSIYTNSTVTVPSSVLSRGEYDKLFPVPPGRGISFIAQQSNGQLSIRGSDAYYPRSLAETCASHRPSTVGIITPATFDKIEVNLDNPHFVHYHPSSGRIVAATPARLIAQITSPEFLDYELLADFFLTFRCFMQCDELLDYLFARLRWALTSGNDSGRIARVRTFVALRHWILNYFADDFMLDAPFRQNFCDYVNELAAVLRQRPDRGGGDMNIMIELKKCWMRTCALYWPAQDSLDVSLDVDIVPGGIVQQTEVANAASALSLPLSIRPTTYRGSIFEMTTIQLPDKPEPRHVALNDNVPSQRSTLSTNRTASIPASPLSEVSLEVLSCSVPFLRNIRSTARTREREKRPEPRIAAVPPKANKAVRPKHHKRSGSFSDALRDKRTPLSSPNADNIELKDLASFVVTGGLVRGLLLQPSPSSVSNTVPVTPGPELNEARFPAIETEAERNDRRLGVRNFVGEVRRALSNRKGSSSRSPTRSTSTKGSKGSREAVDHQRPTKRRSPDWQQLPGPARLDVLGILIEKSYKNAWDTASRSDIVPIKEKPSQTNLTEYEAERADTPRPLTAHKDKSVPCSPPTTGATGGFQSGKSSYVRDFSRLDSHVTNGSRSIVIVDATGAPELPMMSGALPSLQSLTPEMVPIPLFRHRAEFDTSAAALYRPSEPPRTASGEPSFHWRSSDARMHDLLASPDRWSLQSNMKSKSGGEISSTGEPRKSSSLNPEGLGLDIIPNQLRRVPGGNLRDANHVRSLEIAHPRPRSEGTITSSKAMTVASLISKRSTEEGGVMLPISTEDLRVLKTRNSLVLLATHSSQPNLRPSFEVEARKLKGLPDEVFEGYGGIEDALLKLEGKIPSPSSSNFTSAGDSGKSSTEPQTSLTPATDLTKAPEATSRDESPLPKPPMLIEMPTGEIKPFYGDIPMKISPSIQSNRNYVASPLTETQGASIYHPSMSEAESNRGFPLPYFPPKDAANVKEEDEDSSTSSTSVVPMVARLSRPLVTDPYTAASTPESFAYVHSPQSINSNSGHFATSGAISSFRPGPWENQNSFLLDDNQSISDISTEIAEYDLDRGVRSFYYDETPGEENLPIRPFQPIYATPPSTVGGETFESPDRRQLLPRAVPPAPGQTLKQKISNPKLQEQAANQPFPRRPNASLRRTHSSPSSSSMQVPQMSSFDKHIPFVLGYESEIIAEQLTIIEKDALDEVDWKDLISLNWQQTPSQIRNWVDYLNKETSNGIDIVIARFNLVVKWCISEIVLTEAPTERARAITKYIHIASHCHRLRNYASLYQITLALLSNEISRLHMTWSLVALREKHMLEQLERLCRPIRNFHNLRAEMETAMPNAGIIPFIGLYTHDLMFNALKSAKIDPPNDANVDGKPPPEPLVNFERYQTAASIVKNLLRLIEASGKYTFNPEPEALSRCLWIAALEDGEIQARSLALEKE